MLNPSECLQFAVLSGVRGSARASGSCTFPGHAIVQALTAFARFGSKLERNANGGIVDADHRSPASFFVPEPLRLAAILTRQLCDVRKSL
jgi:hypothetical protein